MNHNFDVSNAKASQDNAYDPRGVLHGQNNGNSSVRNHDAIAGDEITKLVQRLLILPATDGEAVVIVFCGVDQGAGCSWVSARTGEVLADQVHGKVCIVDMNLRAPSLHNHFRVDMNTGFADAMRGSNSACDFIRPTATNNLWLLTAGNVGKEPNGALNPGRLRRLFAELRGEFKHILVDTPAMSRHADALFLGPLTDGIVLVVNSNSTRRESARIAKETFEKANIPMIGAVLNRRTYPIPEALYHKL